MLDLAAERQYLVKADRDIADGEERVRRQVVMVEELRQRGQSVTLAESLLRTLRHTLQEWRVHREIILRTIARLEGAPAGPVPPRT